MLISSNSIASMACKDLMALTDRGLLMSIRSDAKQVDAKTIGALDALRIVDLPMPVLKAQLEGSMAKDLILKRRLSAQERSQLADALIDRKNQKRDALKMIRRFIFARERVSAEVIFSPQQKVKSELMSTAKKYLDSKWSHFSVDQREKILVFFETSVLPDPMFQKDPLDYLRQWKKDRGGFEMLRIPQDQVLSFLENLLEKEQLQSFAMKAAGAGLENADAKAFYSVKWAQKKAPVAPPVAPVTGVLEVRLKDNSVRLENIEAKSKDFLNRLDRGGPGWEPLSSNLVERISSAVEEYGHTNFDVITDQRAAALEKIKTALRNSAEFQRLPTKDIEDLTRVIANGDRLLNTPAFGTKHLLYQLLAEMKLNSSPGLIEVLISLQTLSKERLQIYQNNMEINSFLSAGLKGVTSARELEVRFAKVQSELESVSKIPDEVVDSIVTFAREYQASNYGNFDVMTPGHHVAIGKYKEFVKTHSFFKSATEDDLERLQWNWNRATTRESAVSLLFRIGGNSDVEAKRRELLLLSQAITFLRGR